MKLCVKIIIKVMQIDITIYFFIYCVMPYCITNKEVNVMQVSYAYFFKTADKSKRKVLIENLAEEYEESNVHERRYLQKQYDEIKEILFQEGKFPM